MSKTHQLLILLTLLTLSSLAEAQYEIINIDGYRYEQFSTSDVASINLYDSRNKQRGILIFLPLSATDLPPAAKGNDGLIRMYYRSERLPAVIDQLRNEYPIRLNYWTGNPSVHNSHIGTTKIEPVGEAEF